MRSLEKGKRHESLDATISRIAYAYGFSAPPIAIPKRALANAPEGTDAKTATAMALVTQANAGPLAAQSWGLARHGAGTVVSFAITSSKQAIAHAIVAKTVLSVAELAGFTDLTLLISSIGDAESRKRFTRELSNFFRKHHDVIAPELKHLATQNPDAAYHAMIRTNDPALARAPKPIDYLSEASRKTMLATLSLLEAVGITYAIEPRLPAHANVNAELLFAIEGTRRGERSRIAEGGRYDEHMKREKGKPDAAIAFSIELPGRIECEAVDEEPYCFVVNVGDAAKLRAFTLLEALWRAHVAVGQALMAENFRDQMDRSKASNAKYLAIVGQREALDGTVIVRTIATQMQTTLPLDKLGAYVSRAHR